MGKLATPDWIREGFDSKEEYEKKKGIKTKKEKSSPVRSGSSKSQTKGKTFKIRRCPKCKSDKVSVVLTGEEGKGSGEWECKNCGWKGRDIREEELSEEGFMKYLDENGAEVI
jgi:DNA-directed RNA polymerase subunit M/transcription elongation factor TFIIS